MSGSRLLLISFTRRELRSVTDPNGKIPPEAYTLIVKEYSSDLSVKKDAEKLALKEKVTPKKSLSIDDMETGKEGDTAEPDEDFLITDISGVKKHIDFRTEIKKPEIKTVGKIDLTPPAKPVKKEPESPVEKPVPLTESESRCRMLQNSRLRRSSQRLSAQVDLDNSPASRKRRRKSRPTKTTRPEAAETSPEPVTVTPEPVAQTPVTPRRKLPKLRLLLPNRRRLRSTVPAMKNWQVRRSSTR